MREDMCCGYSTRVSRFRVPRPNIINLEPSENDEVLIARWVCQVIPGHYGEWIEEIPSLA